MTFEEKQREEEKRDRMYDPVLRWKHIQEMITWAEANMPEHLRRNRPRLPKPLGVRSSSQVTPLLVLGFLVLGCFALHAEDWTTIGGKVYHEVRVVSLAPDAVTILHQDGGALVPLELLPPELQKRFNYDPDKARAAADRRAQEELADARALRVERVQAEQVREAKEAAEVTAVSSTVPPASSATPSSTTHFSMDSIISSAGSLHRDMTDPSYHTSAHLGVEMRSLGPDANDPNHHSMGEITGG